MFRGNIKIKYNKKKLIYEEEKIWKEYKGLKDYSKSKFKIIKWKL